MENEQRPGEEAAEDERDIAEAMIALAEAREVGTISLDELKRELGL